MQAIPLADFFIIFGSVYREGQSGRFSARKDTEIFHIALFCLGSYFMCYNLLCPYKMALCAN